MLNTPENRLALIIVLFIAYVLALFSYGLGLSECIFDGCFAAGSESDGSPLFESLVLWAKAFPFVAASAFAIEMLGQRIEKDPVKR